MIRLFSTKQLSPSQRQAFTSAGFSLEMEDFIEILPVAPIGAIPQADYFLFSSQNTLLSLAQNPYYAQLPHKRAFCVGEKTRQLLEQKGWEVLASFDYAKGALCSGVFCILLWSATDEHATQYAKSPSYIATGIHRLSYGAHPQAIGVPLRCTAILQSFCYRELSEG